MKIKTTLVILITILSIQLSGQTYFDSLMTKKALQCPDVADNEKVLAMLGE